MVTAADLSRKMRVLLDSELVLGFHFAHAKSRPIFDYDQRCQRAAIWDGDDRRAAIAKLLRLDGVVEAR
jgi:hypothetical protein